MAASISSVDASAWYFWPQNSPIVRNFAWTRGSTPLSAIELLVAVVLVYPFGVYLLRTIMKDSGTGAVNLGRLPAIHNLILCTWSAVMFVGAVQAAILESEENAWLWGRQGKYTWLLCLPPGTRPVGRLFFWSYIYYISKFYELLDTLILVLRDKPLTLLHVYHHALVIVMCYLWLEGQQSLQTIALLTNTGIHVIMYFYFFLHSLGMPPPWKKFVTNSQIIQFLFSLAASVPMVWRHFKRGGCAGFYPWVFNVIFNITLLALFVDFHRRSYGQRKRNSGEKKGEGLKTE